VQQGAGPRPFDVTTRRLIESDPVGWLTWLGLPVDGPVQPLDSEVSTVLAEVDKVLEVGGPSPWLAHIEVQTGRDPDLPARMLQYHVLLRYRDKKPVESTVVLLRPDADGPELSAGRLDLHGVTGAQTVAFWFRVVRIWERPVDELLNGGLGVLPLAPIAAVEPERLPEVIRRMGERFEHEAPPSLVGDLWAATDLLLGLRYDRDLAQHLLRGVRGMRESATYQAILEEGRVEGEARGARRVLLALGTSRFGAPDVGTAAAIERLDNPDVLDRLALNVHQTSSWQELLATVPGL
jgi:predicted transposase YdaD